MPAHREKTDPSKSDHIKWGTKSDVTTVDGQRAVAEANAAAILTKLYGKQAGKGNGRKITVTPWLLIRYDNTDHGYRPITSPVFYESPDIWIESSDPMGNPVPGTDNYVHARVINLGFVPAAPVKVDFYWGDPSLGLDAAHMHWIGTEQVPVIGSLRAFDVRCEKPWVPVFENGGHECVIVNCTNWIGDPILSPFQPVLDRHVGQRNFYFQNAKPGQLISMTLQLSNVLRAETVADVLVDISYVSLTKATTAYSQAEALSAILGFNGQNTPTVAAVGRSYDAPYVQARIAGPSRFYALPPLGSQNPRSGTGSAPRPAHAAQVRPMPTTRILRETLQPGERRPLVAEVAVPQSAVAGEFIVCRLYQSAQAQVTGGYTIVLQVSQG
jgi:hypothetical protein